MIYAGSRDRTIYAWNWPREKAEEAAETTVVSDDHNALVPEATTTLQAHSLGVTALAHSEGVCVVCVCGCVVCVLWSA